MAQNRALEERIEMLVKGDEVLRETIAAEAMISHDTIGSIPGHLWDALSDKILVANSVAQAAYSRSGTRSQGDAEFAASEFYFAIHLMRPDLAEAALNLYRKAPDANASRMKIMERVLAESPAESDQQRNALLQRMLHPVLNDQHSIRKREYSKHPKARPPFTYKE
jgi:hypothetical protein